MNFANLHDVWKKPMYNIYPQQNQKPKQPFPCDIEKQKFDKFVKQNPQFEHIINTWHMHYSRIPREEYFYNRLTDKFFQYDLDTSNFFEITEEELIKFLREKYST